MWKYLIVILIGASVLQYGCKKDEDDDEQTPLPEQLFLDSVIVEAMPFTDESGAGWDVSTGPDVFFRMLQGSSIFTTSGRVDNVAPNDLPVRWLASPSLEVPTWTTDLVVDLWEYDDIADDYIGNVVFDFETQAQQHGYVRTYTATNASETIRVRLVVYWLYP